MLGICQESSSTMPCDGKHLQDDWTFIILNLSVLWHMHHRIQWWLCNVCSLSVLFVVMNRCPNMAVKDAEEDDLLDDVDGEGDGNAADACDATSKLKLSPFDRNKSSHSCSKKPIVSKRYARFAYWIESCSWFMLSDLYDIILLWNKATKKIKRP